MSRLINYPACVAYLIGGPKYFAITGCDGARRYDAMIDKKVSENNFIVSDPGDEQESIVAEKFTPIYSRISNNY